MNFSPQVLMHLIDLLLRDSLLNVMGVGSQELPVTALSILPGGHVRVGFEDNIYYQKGELAESNAKLVARIARIGRDLGCRIATPGEAKDRIGIPPIVKVGRVYRK